MQIYRNIILTTLSLAAAATCAWAAPTVPEASTADLLEARQKIENRREVIAIYKEIRTGLAPKSAAEQHQAVNDLVLANARIANIIYQQRFQLADACRKHFNVSYLNSEAFHLAANRLLKSRSSENEAKVLLHSLLAEDLRAREQSGTVGQSGILVKSNTVCLNSRVAQTELNVALANRHRTIQNATLSLLGQVGVETLHDLASRLASDDLDDAIFDRNFFFASIPVTVLLPMGFISMFPKAAKAINITLAATGAAYGAYQGYKISAAMSGEEQIFSDAWQKRLDEMTELIQKDPAAGELLVVLEPYFQTRAMAYTQAMEETHQKLLPLLTKYGSLDALEEKTIEHRIKVETELKRRGVSL